MASVDLPEPKKHTEMTSKLTDQLTDRQARILEYIRYQNKVRNYPPSVREIGEAVGLSSSSTVHNHLNQLERRGLIRRDPSKSRTVQLVQDENVDKQRRNAVSVPIGAKITVASVTQPTAASVITVDGTGFSTRTVINFFNKQGAMVVNLGGLKPGGAPKIPLTFINETRFTFTKPAMSVAGPAYVQALNPPFVPFTTSMGPKGAFTLK